MMDGLSNVSNDAIAAFQIAWERQDSVCARENSARNLLVKQAKKEGVPTEAAIEAIRTKKRRGSEEARIFMRDLLRSLALANMPMSQQDLFEGWNAGVSPGVKAEADLWAAEDAGFKAGRHRMDLADCPFSPGSEQHAVWHREYRKGELSRVSEDPDTTVAPATRKRGRPPRQARIPGTEQRMRRPGRAPSEEAAAPAE
jgi:hypothetical protein